MAVLLTDDFNRANSTTSIGTPTTGGPYTVRVGTWGINSNQAYSPSATANGHVTFPAAVNVDVQATMPTLAGTQGLIVRWTSTTSYYFLANTSGRWYLGRNVAGTMTYIVMGPANVNGDVLRVVTLGDYIYGLVNGTYFGALQAGPSTAAVAGIYTASAGSRIDDLTASDATAIPSAIDGSTAISVDVARASSALGVGFVYKGRNTKTQDTGAVG